jgi:hypothetical protein
LKFGDIKGETESAYSGSSVSGGRYKVLQKKIILKEEIESNANYVKSM